VDIKALNRAVDEILRPSFPSLGFRKVRNPYYLAFVGTIGHLAMSARELGISGPIDFVFDDTKENPACTAGWSVFRETFDARYRDVLGDPPSFKSDCNMRPLQAADLYAWWVRYWMENGIKGWTQEPLFSWEVRRTIPAIHALWDETAIRQKLTVMLEQAKQLPNAARFLVSDGEE
jgi:hypothetical protein